nr:SDR family oxidoreductase [uncultured Pseudodesulfovibrio sp.]
MAHDIKAHTILITGISGMLGLNLALMLRDTNRVIGTVLAHPVKLSGVSCRQMNLADPLSITEVIEASAPDTVIHCAAMTTVDGCESDPEMAIRINGEATGLVAKASADARAKLVYISTDAVFKGDRGEYTENDHTDPVNTYGRSKLVGEALAVENHPAPLILRTNIFGLTGRPGQGLARWILDQGKANRSFTGFTDSTFTPLLVNSLGEVIMECLQSGITGIHHAASVDAMNKYNFARELLQEWGYNPTLVRQGFISDINFTAPRPTNSALDGSRLNALLHRNTGVSVQTNIRRMHALAQAGLTAELENAFHP